MEIEYTVWMNEPAERDYSLHKVIEAGLKALAVEDVSVLEVEYLGWR